MSVEKIKVIILNPKEPPYTKEIEHTLENFQSIVGGLIDFIELEKDVDLIFNDESKILNMEMNRIIKNDIVCGTCFIVGQKNGENISLTPKQIKKYLKLFDLRKQTIPIAALEKKYKNSSELLNINLTGIEKLLEFGGLKEK